MALPLPLSRGMRCWACSRAIHLPDLVSELPIVGAIVHIACYERETSERPLRALTLTQALLRLLRRDGWPRKPSAAPTGACRA